MGKKDKKDEIRALFDDDDDLENEFDDIEEDVVEEDVVEDDEEEAPPVKNKNKAKKPVILEEEDDDDYVDDDDDDDDDEEDIPLPTAKKSTKKAKPVKGEDTGSIWSGVALPSSMKVLREGQVDSRFPISKYKATKGVKDRIHLLTEEPLSAKTHFLDGYGYFNCFEGQCCAIMGLPTLYYLYPIIKYDTTSKGKVVSAEYEIMFIALPETKYKQFILPTVEEGDSVTDVDFSITCTETKNQKYSMTRGKCVAKTSDKFNLKKILKEAGKLVHHIPTGMARTLDPDEFAAMNNEDTDTENDEDILDVLS